MRSLRMNRELVNGHLGKEQSEIACRVGRVAALQSAIAAAATTACDGFWGGHDDGREGNNWQEEGGCADEHCD